MAIYRFKDWSWSRLERNGVLWVYFWLVCISLLPNTAIATRLHIVWSERTETPIDIYWVTNPNPVEASVYVDVIKNNQFQDVQVDAKNASPYTEGKAIYPLSDIMACVLHMRNTEETRPHPRYEQEWKEQTMFNLNRESEISKKTFENFDLRERNCQRYELFY